MKKTIALTILNVAIVIMAMGMQSVWAGSIIVSNYSFEDAAGVEGGLVWSLVDWTVTTDVTGTSYIVASQEEVADEGLCRGLLNGSNGTTEISQVLSANLEANTTYELTVAVGGDSANGGAYDIALFAGGVELVSGSNPAYHSTDPLTYADATITYTSGASVSGDPLEIVLRSNGENYWTVYDNVRLTAEPVVVPEPATWALLLIGAVCLAPTWLRSQNR